MAKTFAKLNHHCGAKGMEGQPGDVIEVTADQLKYLLARRGATECDAKGEPIKQEQPADK